MLAPDQLQTVQIRGLGSPAQLFLYGAEGCPRLGFSGGSFAIIAAGAGGMTLLTPQPMPTDVRSVAVSDGYIVAISPDYAPSDPRCCPSRQVQQRWTASGGRLVRAP